MDNSISAVITLRSNVNRVNRALLRVTMVNPITYITTNRGWLKLTYKCYPEFLKLNPKTELYTVRPYRHVKTNTVERNTLHGYGID